MRYCVEKTTINDPPINSPEWERAAIGRIDQCPWKGYEKAPDTTFRLLRSPNGLCLLFHTDEKHLRAEVSEHNGMIYTDSCIEFFFKPDNHDVNYLNFEINPNGMMRLSIGACRGSSRRFITERDIFNIVSIPNEGDWTLKFFIPDSFLTTYFAKISSVCRGNFYKCGDMTDHPHYASWSKVEVSKPDFHIPDFFGFIEL